MAQLFWVEDGTTDPTWVDLEGGTLYAVPYNMVGAFTADMDEQGFPSETFDLYAVKISDIGDQLEELVK